VRSLDTENIMELAFSVLNFATQVSAPEACLLIKIWDNGEAHKLEKAMKELYTTCKSIKPHSSRSDSAEKFLFAKGFKAL
jgi:23S rRNA (uridine2552-2'-O)-methyltransferase